MHLAERLVLSKMPQHMVLDRGLMHRRTFSQNDVSDRTFTSLFVRSANHRGVGNPRVGEQYGLKLRWSDLKSVYLDRFLEAVVQDEIPVLVDVGDVAGPQPAIRCKRFQNFFGAVEISFLHMGAAHPQLTGGADGHIFPFFGIDDPERRI